VRSILSKTAQDPFETLFAAYKDFLKHWKDADPDPHPEANQSVVREAAIVCAPEVSVDVELKAEIDDKFDANIDKIMRALEDQEAVLTLEVRQKDFQIRLFLLLCHGSSSCWGYNSLRL
jgi:hypothetical protein